MSNFPRVFSFESNQFRTVTINDSAWFVAVDVCKVLDIGNTSAATSRLDDDEKGVASIDTLGGAQSLQVINESGLYSLIMTSRKKEAKNFKKWVTSEVLPQIRKTGNYSQAPENPLLQLANAVLTAHKVIEDQSSRLALAEPKADAFDAITNEEGELCLTDAAKYLHVPPRKFNQFLQAQGWIFKRNGSGSWTAYQRRIDQGFLTHKRVTYERNSGETEVVWQPLVTPEGIKFLSLYPAIQEIQSK